MFKSAKGGLGSSDVAKRSGRGLMHHNETLMVVILFLGIVAGAIAVFLERPKPRVHYHDEPQIRPRDHDEYHE